MKQQNFDLEVARHFFIEKKYYIIQKYLKENVCILDFAILDVDHAFKLVLFMIMRLLSTCIAL